MEFNFLNYNNDSLLLNRPRSKKVAVHLDSSDIFSNKPQVKKRPHTIHVYGNNDRVPLKPVSQSNSDLTPTKSTKRAKIDLARSQPSSHVTTPEAFSKDVRRPSFDTKERSKLPEVSIVDDSEEEPIFLTSSTEHSQTRLLQSQLPLHTTTTDSNVPVSQPTNECYSNTHIEMPLMEMPGTESQLSNSNFQGEDFSCSHSQSDSGEQATLLNSSPKHEYQFAEPVVEEEQKEVIVYAKSLEEKLNSYTLLDDKNTQYNQQVTLQESDLHLESKQDLEHKSKLDHEMIETPPQESIEIKESCKRKNSTVSKRPNKPTLAELCSRTNFAKNRTKVGLSKKIKIDSLHTYLNK